MNKSTVLEQLKQTSIKTVITIINYSLCIQARMRIFNEPNCQTKRKFNGYQYALTPKMLLHFKSTDTD